jgi:hypothetical protein
MTATRMSKSERVELGQLIRKREKVMKSLASERAAKMLAEFDAQSATLYSFDQDEVWKASTEEAKKVVEEANAVIADRCAKLGIPAEFAPSLNFGWCERGENAVASRRAELRRMAVARIKAIEAETITKIERLSLTAQTEVIANGLQSDAARQFLESMPSLETLMPSVPVSEIKQLQDEKIEARNRRNFE